MGGIDALGENNIKIYQPHIQESVTFPTTTGIVIFAVTTPTPHVYKYQNIICISFFYREQAVI